MNSGENIPAKPKLRAGKVVFFLAGVLLLQVLLYGSSLIGSKILLPIDILALDGMYLPRKAEYQRYLPVHDPVLTDQVLSFEISRRFCAAEFRAGRLPLWCPNYFLGAPNVVGPLYSPFHAIYYLFPSPLTLAWIQVLKSIVAACGALLFFRKVLQVSFWPATFAAWCYPLTGFLIMWQGYPVSQTIVWYPWLLLAVEATVRRPAGWGGLLLAVVTLLLLISGQVDMAGLALIGSGLYAIWCLVDQHIRRSSSARTARAALALLAGWTLGFLLSTPYLLPLVEYSSTGFRMQMRGKGMEERPPEGIQALPATVMPDLYGRTQHGSARLVARSRLESSAATYTGLMATLLLAPLAWTQRLHMSRNFLWLVVVVLSLSWSLNIPGLVQLWHMPGLNMLSYNRFVFAASMAILSMAAVGLDALWNHRVGWRSWFWGPLVLVVVLGLWSLHRSFILPEPFATTWDQLIADGPSADTMEKLRVVQHNFASRCLVVVALCFLTAVGWLGLRFRLDERHWFAPLIGTLIVIDLLGYAYDVNPQCDPHLYYPPIATLEKLAKGPPGRIVGYQCLPPRLAETHRLRDVRGYDGVDPTRLMELIFIAADPASVSRMRTYALTMDYLPKLAMTEASGIFEVHPVLDMMNVRYMVLRGGPPSGVRAWLAGDDYWVLRNPRALPRLFVPSRVEVIADHTTRLERLADQEFDPRNVAFVEQPVDVPDACSGTATIEQEIPGRVIVAARMETPGLLVMADLWDKGWKSTIDGRPCPILRTNHALRGMVLPAGTSRIVMEYSPLSFRWGTGMMLIALGILLVWFVCVLRNAMLGLTLN